MTDAARCTVAGGSGSSAADFADMRSTADRLDTSGDDARALCRAAAGVGLSIPPTSAALSPGSALGVADQIAHLTLGLAGLTGRMEFVARTMRWSAAAYELTDAAQRRLLAAINVSTAPVRLGTDIVKDAALASLQPGGDGWAAAFAAQLGRDVADDPDLADGLIPWVSGATQAAGPYLAHDGLGAPPPDLEGQLAWILAAGRALGYFNDTRPLSVLQTSARTGPAGRRQLGDVVQDAADVEQRSDRSTSVVSVRRIQGADGTGAWVVAIPGTKHWSLHTGAGPSDATADLATMAGTASSLYPAIERAITAAMRESGVTPGTEPVMLVGHSQGGLVATRLAADDRFRARFDVREVVTAGSPIDRMEIPDEVGVLSIENVHDVVPHADGTPAPDAINRVDVTCETPDGERLHTAIDAHAVARYARSARELTADRTEDQLSRWYARNHRFLDGRETDYEFRLRRD